jgi:hypothetical protein
MLRSTIAAAAASTFLALCAPAAASPAPATVPALGSYLAAHGSTVAQEFSDQRRYHRHRHHHHRYHRHRYRHCWNQRMRVRTPIGAFTYRTVRRCAWRYR